MPRTLPEMLLELRLINRSQLSQAQEHAHQWEVSVEQALLDRRFCSADDLLRACSQLTGYPVIALDSVALSPTAAQLLPQKFAEERGAVPLKLSGARFELIELAMAPPADLEAVDAALALTGKRRAVVHLAHADAIRRALNRLYHPGSPEAVAVAAPRERKTEVQNEQMFELSDEPSPSTPMYLFGWHAAAGTAISDLLRAAGFAAELIDEAALDRIGPYDLLISTTLGLRTVLPAEHRLKCRLVICGTDEPGDAEDARALGARLYLKPPHTTEQFKRALQHLLAPR